jgi:uncharacterized membrane protein YqjE
MIYGPASFGVYAVYAQLVSIFGEVANGRYEFALIIPDEDREASNLFILSIVVLLSTCCILFLLLLVSHGILLRLLKIDDESGWIFLVPVGVFSYSLYNLLCNWNIRRQELLSSFRAPVSSSRFRTTCSKFFSESFPGHDFRPYMGQDPRRPCGEAWFL